MSEYLGLWLFPALLGVLFLGVPVAFALMGVAFVFGFFVFGDAAVYMYAHKVQDISSSHILAAAPLFIFMGAMLERSGIANKLFEAIHLWTRRLPGGLAIGTILMCVVFAASSGVVGATETVVGMLAIPVMMRHGYDRGLISGTICAGGSLGSIIPPSVLVVILATVGDLGIGDLFTAMLLPGLILAGLYIIYILVRCTAQPTAGPRLPPADDEPGLAEKLRITVVAFVPPLALIAGVLGSIIFAVAVPTEAAAVGAAGSILLTLLYGTYSHAVLREALLKTLTITAMILTIVVGGTMFGGVFVKAGGLTQIEALMGGLGLGRWGTLWVILGIIFVAGFVLDLITIILIIVPFALPLMVGHGFDRIWFAIAMLIMMQTSLLTPPMAGALFYLRSIAPPEIRLIDMYTGVMPFIALHFAVLGLIIWFPDIALWLPRVLLGFE